MFSVVPLVNSNISFYGLPYGSGNKESARNAGDPSLIPGSGRSPGEGNGNQLQCSCLGNPMDRGAQQAIVYGATKSWTQPSDWHFQDQFLRPGTLVSSQNCTREKLPNTETLSIFTIDTGVLRWPLSEEVRMRANTISGLQSWKSLTSPPHFSVIPTLLCQLLQWTCHGRISLPW